jgi:hypothetical protein
MRLKLQKRSEWKFVSRIILHKQVFYIPQLAAESVSKACFGVHTRDSFREIVDKQNSTSTSSFIVVSIFIDIQDHLSYNSNMNKQCLK